ncbi:MAG: hypothetical protein CVV52_10370 [Spirochaetae bacterium HGW-Spirochaetae-8]|jgi:hypothetical protein|nr:MAG: hypothetical protein CVV52_10370 [Spirochaetae bacterium HGW-Spirochaetae-8]
MDSIVLVALITGCVSLSNGVLLAMLNRKWKKKDQCNDDILEMKGEISEVKDNVEKIYKLLDRLGKAMKMGLDNDRVIFDALRKKQINGKSEEQERLMDDYFAQCTADGFMTDKER